MHYVKIQNGTVVGKPEALSSDPSRSPNKDWKPEQLVAMGYALVETDTTQDEKLDHENPIIQGHVVTYPRIKKTNGELKKERDAKDDNEKLFFRKSFKALNKKKKKEIFNDLKTDPDLIEDAPADLDKDTPSDPVTP